MLGDTTNDTKTGFSLSGKMGRNIGIGLLVCGLGLGGYAIYSHTKKSKKKGGATGCLNGTKRRKSKKKKNDEHYSIVM